MKVREEKKTTYEAITSTVIDIFFSIHNAWSICNIQYPAYCSCFAFPTSMPDSGQASVKKY